MRDDSERAESTITVVLNRPDGTRLALDLVDPDDHEAVEWPHDACECDECVAYWAVHKLAMEVPEDLGRWRELPVEARGRGGGSAAGLSDGEFAALLQDERRVHAEITSGQRRRRQGAGLGR